MNSTETLSLLQGLEEVDRLLEMLHMKTGLSEAGILYTGVVTHVDFISMSSFSLPRWTSLLKEFYMNSQGL